MAALLFRHDPIGLDFGHNTDEYEPEAESIAARLSEARTEHDLRRVVHEEFVRWFDAELAGPPERFDAIAREIWRVSRDEG